MKDFIFDGKTLSDFGYIICAFDSISDETLPVSNMEYTTVKAPLTDISEKVDSSYPENLTKTIQICKSPCQTKDDIIQASDISELAKWLCRKEYKWFAWNDDTDYGEIWYEAQINMSKIIIGGLCRGLELTINTNRPYGVTPLIDVTSNGNVEMKVYSDEEGIIYPDVVITANQAGKLTLKNSYDSSKTIITCNKGETIIMYGSIQQIKSSQSRDLCNDNFNFVFPHLCSKFNKHINKFTADLDCTITFSYREIRKVGI